MKYEPIKGLEGFKEILRFTRPVNDSREIWLKLGHNKFVVGNYTTDGHFPIWSTSGSGRNRKKTKQHPDCWEYISNWAKNNDGGVFFIPTQPSGYPIKSAISFSDDVAAELDEGTAQQQWDKIAEFVKISGLEPAYIIHSGSKSYHPHWKATDHLPIAQTIYLRQLLCIALNSDTAIANPHQPMRIAGFYRKEKGREQTLEYSSDSRYSYDEFITGIKAYFKVKNLPFPKDISSERWRIYKRGKRDGNLDKSILIKPENELTPQYKYPNFSTVYRGNTPIHQASRIPLHLALSKANQSALRGVASSRNNTGVALALDLIGCYHWLINNGYTVDGEPYKLFIDYCISCTPGGGWNSREWESIWRSANSSNPTPAKKDLSDFVHWYRWSNEPDYKQACIAEWKKNNRSSLLGKEISKEEYDEKFTLPRIIKTFGRKLKSLANHKLKAYGFSKKQLEKQSQNTYQPKYYEKQERLDIWASNKQKFIKDSSETASGKSFDSGRVKLKQFGVEKIFYITGDPRNVTTPTLKDGWVVNQGRHGGLVKDQHNRIRVAKGNKEEEIVTAANCMRTKTIAALSKKNIDGANSSELICGGCSNYGLCKSGVRYKNAPTGYLGDRREALTSPKIITHPSSLPSPEHFDDYENSVLIWDEWSVILKNAKQIKVIESDLKEIILHLTRNQPELLTQLLPLFTELGKIFAEKAPTRFGWNHEGLSSRLKPILPDDIDWDGIAKATEPNLDALNPTLEYGCDIQDMPKEVKKMMNDSDHQTAGRIEATAIKQWIIPFLNILAGEAGYLSKSGGVLTITVPDNRLIDIAHAASKNIFLDATGHLPDLARLLAIAPPQIEHIAVKPSQGANTKIIQVAGLGRLGQSRGKHQERQTIAITKALEEKHPGIRKIGFKKFVAKAEDLRWFIESRGANDAERDKALILEGIPTPNLEALAAEFTCLYGRVPESGTTKVKYKIDITNKGLPSSGSPYLELNESVDPEFRAFVRRKVLANIHQGIGRARANRREGEELIIYILGDYPLDFPVDLVKAVDITPEAASKMEQFEMALKGAIAQLKSEGKKVTQTALAQITGYSQGYISRFSELLLLLLESFNSKSNNFEPPPDPPPDDVVWLAKEYLPLVQNEQLLEEIFNISEVFTKYNFLFLFDLIPFHLKEKLIYWLLATQSESLVERIGTVT